MVLKQPYFMKDPSWYYYDYEEMIYKLTDKAPQRAIDSYNEFYEQLAKFD